MIFVTVGSMLPFDRLIMAMDRWAGENDVEEIFAQIGDGAYIPESMPFERLVTPAEFEELYDRATLIVAHAGMGSVISAAEIGKPIVILPRLAAWKEHTTDHQVETAARLRGKPGILVADTESDLPAMIAQARNSVLTTERLPRTAPTEFVERIRQSLVR